VPITFIYIIQYTQPGDKSDTGTMSSVCFINWYITQERYFHHNRFA